MLAFSLAALGLSCKRSKPPKVARLWLGPTGGCAETIPDGKASPLACWGENDHGQLGDGTTTSRDAATALALPFGKLTDLALGATHGCGVFDARVVACWGDGLGAPSGDPKALAPVKIGEGSFTGQAIAVGRAHTCIRVAADALSCFGADDAGQLGSPSGPYPAPSKDWSGRSAIVSFALGAAHTCVAHGGEAAPSTVVCRGRAPAAPREPLVLTGGVKELAAGDDHTCALLANGAVACWGKNDAGQLGDGTTVDAAAPVPVADVAGAIQVATGARHSCALLYNGTIACWGQNAHHELANGTTENSSRAHVIVGIVGARELSLAGEGGCVRLDGGYARCWGRNDRGQLGDGSTVEHSVPMPMHFR